MQLSRKAVDNTAIPDFLESLGKSRFWGAITLKFEDGHVVHLRREENLKPNELPRGWGINDATTTRS